MKPISAAAHESTLWLSLAIIIGLCFAVDVLAGAGMGMLAVTWLVFVWRRVRRGST